MLLFSSGKGSNSVLATVGTLIFPTPRPFDCFQSDQRVVGFEPCTQKAFEAALRVSLSPKP